MIYNFTITNKSTLKFLKCEAMIRTLYRFIFDSISYKFLLYFITFHNSYSSFHSICSQIFAHHVTVRGLKCWKTYALPSLKMQSKSSSSTERKSKSCFLWASNTAGIYPFKVKKSLQEQNYSVFRVVLITLSNINDGAYCENSSHLNIVNYFRKKTSL